MIDFWQQSAVDLNLPATTVACVVRAAAHYDVPPGLVLSVMKVEGGVNGAVHRNANGSYDYGLMQVNSIWLPKVKTLGFTRDHLINHPCANLNVATWILRQNMDASTSFWTGVGNYHSRNANRNLDYQHKIAAAAADLPTAWRWWTPQGSVLKKWLGKLPWTKQPDVLPDPSPLGTPPMLAALDLSTLDAPTLALVSASGAEHPSSSWSGGENLPDINGKSLGTAADVLALDPLQGSIPIGHDDLHGRRRSPSVDAQNVPTVVPGASTPLIAPEGMALRAGWSPVDAQAAWPAWARQQNTAWSTHVWLSSTSDHASSLPMWDHVVAWANDVGHAWQRATGWLVTDDLRVLTAPDLGVMGARLG